MKLEKELAIAKAHLQVFKEEEEMSPELISDGSSDKEDSQERVRRFLESLLSSQKCCRIQQLLLQR